MIGRWLRWLGYWWRERRHRDALAEEMEHHRLLLQQDLERDGLTSHEAAGASRRAMGNVTLMCEDARDVWVTRWAEALVRDVRYGLRGLRREPMFAATAILTLGLGIATTTTVFSVADSQLWKALPYPQPDRLVVVVWRAPGGVRRTDLMSGAHVLALRSAAPAFTELAGIGMTTRRVLQLDTAQPILVSTVSPNYFDLLGRRAVAGRTFTARDGQGRRAVVFTDRGWRRLFGTDPAEAGRTVTAVTLDGESIAVAGVVPADDALGSDPDAYLAFDETAVAYRDANAFVLFGVLGRLAPGATREVARAQVQAAAADLARAASPERQRHEMDLSELDPFFIGTQPRPLYFFLSASLLVLVLCAVNVAALLVGRALRRRREFALRGALGGGRSALTRQMLAESALLSTPGAVLGLLVTAWLVTGLGQVLPAETLARGSEIPVDFRVAAFTVVVMAIVTALFVLVPLPIARAADLVAALGAGGRAGRGRREGRARAILLAGQIALTMMLVAGAGLFLRSYVGLIRVPLGFETDGVVTVRASLGGARDGTDASTRAYASSLLENALALPRVRAAAIATSSPLGSGPPVHFAVQGRPRPEPGDAPRAILRGVSPGYFETLGIPIVRGRSLTDTDADGAERVAVVNEALADQVFPGEEAVGRLIDLLPGARAPWTRRPGPVRIVGVAANTKDIGINEVAFGNLTMPFAQMPSTSLELVAKLEGTAADVAEELRAVAANVDPQVPVSPVSFLSRRVETALQGDRFNLFATVLFAGLALVVAAVGIYGAASYAADARRREFGVRLAIGATPGRLTREALTDAGRLGAIGAIVGLGGVLVTARLLDNALYLVPGSHPGLLYGVETTDPLVLGAASISAVLVAVAAAAQPAMRVGRVDPLQALRSE